MKRSRERSAAIVAGALFALVAAAGCGNGTGKIASEKRPTLRLGVTNFPALSTERGLQHFILNLSSEGLLRVRQDGRLEAWLAKAWDRSADGRRFTIELREGVLFHDGTPADAATISKVLNDHLSKSLRSVAEDVESIVPKGDRHIEVTFRRPLSLFGDALLDVQIIKPGTTAVATGPFVAATPGGSGAEGAQILSYDNYYLGRPTIDGVAVSTYPNIRAAWAEMLRDRLDMLYEVGAEAIDTLRGARNVSVYTFDRAYQYMLLFNARNPKLKPAAVRQGLNEAVDRAALVRDGLGGYGTPSAGPVSLHHWALGETSKVFTYNPQSAAAKLPKRLRLKCVTIAEPPFEQIALVVKQQLSAVGVDLEVVGLSPEQVVATLGTADFDTVLLDVLSGWSSARGYRWWHTQGTSNAMKYSNAEVDAALVAISHAVNDEEYRKAVAAYQHAIADDPPAMFLAWSQRSRAVSGRFEETPEKGRDVLAMLRMWRPTGDGRATTTN